MVAAQTNDADGVLGLGDCLVTQAATPNMTVDVAAGRGYVLGTETAQQGTYFFENDATLSVTIAAADPTNARKDLVVVRVQDAVYSGAVDDITIEVVTGTPSGTPAEPTVPANSYTLALVDVPALDTSIENAQITDRRSVHNPMYQLVTFTASGSFTKASYPWAKSARIRCVGGGGAGGGAASTAAGQISEGSGGGGGGYAETSVTISSLSASETVTVGAGGAGVSGAAGNGGVSSSFGAWCVAGAGAGGSTMPTGTTVSHIAGGTSGQGTTGDILASGDDGGWAFRVESSGTAAAAHMNTGGGSPLGGTQRSANSGVGVGAGGVKYGGGGSGARSTNAAAQVGGSGAGGVVIIELFG